MSTDRCGSATPLINSFLPEEQLLGSVADGREGTFGDIDTYALGPFLKAYIRENNTAARQRQQSLYGGCLHNGSNVPARGIMRLIFYILMIGRQLKIIDHRHLFGD